MPASHDDDTKQLFLTTLAKTGVIADGLKAAGIKARQTITRWCETDEQFKQGYDDAIAEAADTLEAEARRRAVEGVIRVKSVGSGDSQQIIDEVQYSDTLLLALLKAKKPHEFAERTKAEITNPDGSLKPENEQAAAARLAAILDEAKRRRDQQGAGGDPLFD